MERSASAQPEGLYTEKESALTISVPSRGKAVSGHAERFLTNNGFYKTLVDNSLTGVVIVRHGRIVYTNRKMCEMVGLTEQQLHGLDALCYVHPEDKASALDYHQRRLSGKCLPDEHLMIRLLTATGKMRYCELCTATIDYQGAPAILVNAIDVTGHEQAKSDLSDTEERYRLLFESTPLALLVVKDGVIVTANPAACALLDRSVADLEGTEMCVICTAEHKGSESKPRDCRMKLDRAVWSGMETLDWTLRRPDGSTMQCDVRLTCYSQRGERYVMAIIQDVTQRRADEERRIQLERQLEVQKRQFYRETIQSATEGKLDICETEDVQRFIADSSVSFEVDDVALASHARSQIERFCRDRGLQGEDLYAFIIGVGEAITNALRHASAGKVYAGEADGCVFICITDKGCGIESLLIPRATLQRGFSTKPSMGLGYTLMLSVSDKILLSTGDDGTSIVLLKSIVPEEMREPVDVFPEAWERLES